MLTNKINGLNDPICTDDSSNDFINSGSSPGFTDWRRLDSDNNCFPILAKRSGSGSFPDACCFDKSFVQNWVTCSASGCNYRVAFFQPSQPLPDESECTSEGMVCWSNLSALWLFGNEWGTNWGAGVVLTHRDNLLYTIQAWHERVPRQSGQACDLLHIVIHHRPNIRW